MWMERGTATEFLLGGRRPSIWDTSPTQRLWSGVMVTKGDSECATKEVILSFKMEPRS
jgi:hypothetical protein